MQHCDGSYIAAIEIPPHSFISLEQGEALIEEPEEISDPLLENHLISYRFNKADELVSVFDKETGQEILPEGCRGNRLRLFVDQPFSSDAWNIDFYYEEMETAELSCTGWESARKGPVESAINFYFRTDRSTIIQQIRLPRNGKRLDFFTSDSWFERHRLLRVYFPAPFPSGRPSFDIQYA